MNVKIYRNGVLDFIVIVFDIALMLLSCAAAYAILGLFSAELTPDWTQMAAYALLTLFTLYMYELYTSVIRDNYELKISVFLAVLVACCGCVVFVIIHDLICLHTVRWLVVAVCPAASVMLTVVLYLEKRLYVKVIKSFEGNEKLLVLDDSDRENDFAKKIKYSSLSVYDAWYVMVNDDDPKEVEHIIKTMYPKYNNIFISPQIREDVKNKFISTAVMMGKDLYLIPELYNSIVMRSTLMEFDDTPALKIKTFGLSKAESFFKRVLDIAVAAVGSIIASPVMLICALAVKLDSPGPVFYKQERLTLHKKPFYIYKFRSMVNDAEKLTGPVLATYDDPRITRVGKFLRATRLDELPQLLNVLNGSMSVVGPRPERQKFVDEFEKYIVDYDKRFFVKAGITGMSHVYARYDTSAKDRALFDMLYIRDYSFLLDIKLILLTLKVMFMKDAAAGVKDDVYKSFTRKMETAADRGIYDEDEEEASDGKQSKTHIV